MDSDLPDLRSLKLDFSEFHPLDHSILACRGYPGGWQRHLTLWWRYKQRDELLRPFMLLRCKLGRHQYVRVWRGRRRVGDRCYWCWRPRPEAAGPDAGR